MGPAEMLQAATIARRYFLEDRTKKQIAQECGISRFKVARILDASRADGLVTIAIALPANLDAELSDRLASMFGLHHALVVSTPEASESSLREHLGRAAARLMSETVTEDDVLGIGWGRTLDRFADELTALAPCPVVQMTGVVGTVANNSMELIRRITAVSGGPAFPIYVPLLVPDVATARGLLRQPGVLAARRQFSGITKAVVSVGSWNPPNSQLREVVPPRERSALQSIGVCAEICSTLLAEDGSTVTTDVAARMVAVSTAQLRRVPEVVIVAGGRSKARAMTAVLRAGLATSVVTDAVAARMLLDSATK